MPAIHRELDRAMESVEGKPRDAVSNILESIFKIYIENTGCRCRTSRIFNQCRSDLGLDPESIEDQDLQRIISALFSTVSER